MAKLKLSTKKKEKPDSLVFFWIKVTRYHRSQADPALPFDSPVLRAKSCSSPGILPEINTVGFIGRSNTVQQSSSTSPEFVRQRKFDKHMTEMDPYLLSRLSATDRYQPSLDDFRRNIRKKDMASLIEGTYSTCALCVHLISDFLWNKRYLNK